MTLNAYVITDPVRTLVVASSMAVAVGVYLNDVVKEDQLEEAYGETATPSPTGLSVVKADDDILLAQKMVECEYFDDPSDALEAIEDARHEDQATIFVLDNSVE